MSIVRFYAPAVMLIVFAAGCRHAPPATVVDATNTGSPCCPTGPSRSPAAAACRRASPVPSSDGGGALSTDVGRRAQCLASARRCLLRLRREHAARRRKANAAVRRAVAREVVEHALRVDGLCDERGSAEYNLALGDRRAQVVRDYLSSLGVRPERLQVRSLGKDAPFCHESNESCWEQNRRGHMVITAK